MYNRKTRDRAVQYNSLRACTAMQSFRIRSATNQVSGVVTNYDCLMLFAFACTRYCETNEVYDLIDYL